MTRTINLELDCERHHCGNCQCKNGGYCNAFDTYLTRDSDGCQRADQCLTMETGERHSITVQSSDKYLTDEQGRILEFCTVNDAITYLADKGHTLADILTYRINLESIKEAV